MSPAIAGKILEYQTDFDNYFKKVGEWAMKQALQGVEIPGFKLVYGKSNRKWADADKIVGVLKKDFELDDPFTKKVLSPAQAEKKLDKAGKVELAKHIIKPTGKTILVDEHDTREAVSVAVEADMAEFAEPESVVGQQSDAPDDIDALVDSLNDDDEVKRWGSDDVVLEGKNSTPPKKSTKKYQLMELGMKGGVLITDAADALFGGSESQVTRGLRNLNERDGYTVILHAHGAFTVKEA
jgi:hypothetical protein